MTEDEDVDYGDCDGCKVAVLGGLVLDLCDQSAEFTPKEKQEGNSCRVLRKRYEEDEITPVELIKELRPRLKGEERKRLEDVIKAAKESGIELEGLEEDAK